MRRFILALVSAVAFLFVGHHYARAQLATYCVNCSTIQQQLLDYLRQFEMLQQEIQTAVNTLNFYENAVKNTTSLPFSVYRDLTYDIQQIEGISQQAQMLTGFPGQMLRNLNSGTGYPDSQLGIGGWKPLLVKEGNAIGNAMTRAAQVLDALNAQISADSTTLASLQAEAMSSDGRQQTLQSLAGANATVGQMIQKQQQTVAATMQATMTYQSAQADRQLLLDGMDDVLHYEALLSGCKALAQVGGTAAECSGAGSASPGAAPNSTGTVVAGNSSTLGSN